MSIRPSVRLNWGGGGENMVRSTRIFLNFFLNLPHGAKPLEATGEATIIHDINKRVRLLGISFTFGGLWGQTI